MYISSVLSTFIVFCCLTFALIAQNNSPKAALSTDSLQQQMSKANDFASKGELTQATDLYVQMLGVAQKQRDSVSQNTILLRLGELYYTQKKYEQAEVQLQQALKLSQQLGDKYNEANALARLSQVYAARNEPQKSLEYNFKSLEKGKEFYDVLRNNYDQMANIYANKGDFKRAYEYREKYVAIKDSLLKADKAKSLTELQMQYEIADKQKEIELLTKDNNIKALQTKQSQLTAVASLAAFLCILVAAVVLLNQFNIKRRSNQQLELANTQISQTVAELEHANTQISQTVAEKETLLKEIHHRVKNNLQLVSSLLDWQTEGISDPQIHKVVDEGRSRIRSMALMHEYLYKSDSLAHVDVHKYLAELADSLMRSYRPHTGITLEKNITHAYFDADTVVPLGLIVNELVSNAFKYAFVDKTEGTVHIALERLNNEEFKLTVSDNGIGLPDNFDKLLHKSLGIQLVKTLVRQMKGTLQSYNQTGAVFEVQFSAKKKATN